MVTDSASYCMLIDEWALSRLQVCLLKLKMNLGSVLEPELEQLEVFSEDKPRAVLCHNCEIKWPRYHVWFHAHVLLSAWFAWCVVFCFRDGTVSHWVMRSVGVSLRTPGYPPHSHSGIAKLEHTGACALATRACAPPVQALLKIIGANVPLSIAN